MFVDEIPARQQSRPATIRVSLSPAPSDRIVLQITTTIRSTHRDTYASWTMSRGAARRLAQALDEAFERRRPPPPPHLRPPTLNDQDDTDRPASSGGGESER